MPLLPSTRKVCALAPGLFAVGAVLVACAAAPPASRDHGCLPGMARIDGDSRALGAFCIDRYEGSLVLGEGDKEFSPYEQVKGRSVRAVSRPGVVPQAYISRNEAEAACRRSRKRLCTEAEWVRACVGKDVMTFPYGDERKPGYCNDHGKRPVMTDHAGGHRAANEWDAMNDPRLNQHADTIATTGSHPSCQTSVGVFDMVGNLHEWVADPAGTFLGGYYLDTKLNGSGCRYKTVAHDAAYHDYSTGFRCCADAL